MQDPENTRPSQWASLLTVAGLAMIALVALPQAAQAHRDGCHAAHSCPSDTGSYVCGDTGNFSECGYTSIPVYVPPDYSAPRRPKMSRPLVGPQGLVQLPVSAEPGSNIVVRSEGRIVGTATATGEQQTVSFRAATGRHIYVTTATDEAGNESVASRVTVVADATPPRTRGLVVEPGTPADSRSHVWLQSDPNTRYVLTIDGRPVSRGIAEQGRIETWLPLSNGAHDVALDLRDKVGNRSVVMRDLNVQVAKLEPTLKLTTAPNESRQMFTLTGTPGSRASVRVSGQPAQTFELDSLSRSVFFDLPDGVYTGAMASLVDPSGRRGNLALGGFTVDTQAPELRLARVASRAAVGWMAFAIAAEVDSSIAWRVLGAGDEVIQEGAFIADGSDENVEFDVEEGDYQLKVIGVDESGNESTSSLTVVVAANPRTAGEIATRIAALVAVVLVMVLAGWLFWRNRARIAAWRVRRRIEAAQRAVMRRHTAAVRAHQASVSQYEAAVLEHQRADAAWRERREFLVGLGELARSATGTTPAHFAEVKLRKGERVYTSVSGVLIDTRTQQGVSQLALVENGRVTITSLRVVFNGSKNREWSYDKLEQLQHVGDTQTIIKVSNRQKPSGVQYADAERTRLFIDLAMADLYGGRAATVAAVERRLAAHTSDRPHPPQHPGPPPSLPLHDSEVTTTR